MRAVLPAAALVVAACAWTPLAAGAQSAPAPASPDSGAHDVTAYARAAEAADRLGDYAAALGFSRRIFALAPTHPHAAYYLARAYARTDRPDSALALLALEARMGDRRLIARDSAFAALRTSPVHAARFARVAAAFAANGRPVVRSRLAFTVPDPDLLPEAMAYDAGSGSFFVGSLAKRKVVRVWPGRGRGAPDSVADVAGPADDIPRVVGVKLDPARHRLWFATWATALDTAGGAHGPGPGVEHTRLFAYDARTGRRIAVYTPRDSARPHAFNDLVVTRAGDVYVTDTDDNSLYRVRAGVDTLELFVRPGLDLLDGPNGIALAGDGRRLYVAGLAGIVVVDVATRQVERLGGPPDVTTGAIDGLAWYGGGDRTGSLVAVQGISSMERVVRFHLDAAGRRVTRAELLERAHPAWRKPTTGVVVRDAFYYIPASGYDRVADDGTLAPAAVPAPTPFFRIDLRRR